MTDNKKEATCKHKNASMRRFTTFEYLYCPDCEVEVRDVNKTQKKSSLKKEIAFLEKRGKALNKLLFPEKEEKHKPDFID